VEITNSITGVFGLSGSGKTTLMNIICGIETPKSGRLTFNDRVFFDKEKKIAVPANKRNIGVVFQEHYLFPHKTIKANLCYSKRYIKGKQEMISFDQVVDLLEIRPLLEKKPAQLSGGERQRVAIGRTLLSQPDLLLMDEPFSNLDRNKRKQIISSLLKINNQFGVPLLIISHDLEDILKLTRSLLIIDNGEVLASGEHLEIGDLGLAPSLVTPRRFLNIFELYHLLYSKEEELHEFSLSKGTGPVLKTSSKWFKEGIEKDNKVRFCIYPENIALNNQRIKHTSVQNQIKGIVSHVRYTEKSCFVSVDCGIVLVAEITRASLKKLDIQVGEPIYCMIKAKAIEVLHIYSTKQVS
jgi:molybdate transport system ATP-binding protein